MTTTVSGGGGGGIAGLTSDGALGILVAHALQAGDANAATAGDFHLMSGQLELQDTPGNNADGDTLLFLRQGAQLLPGNSGQQALLLSRSGALNGGDYSRPAVEIDDTSTTTQPVVSISKRGTTVLELTTVRSITGALSTVTDAAAKAVLTSIVATLTGIKVATNNTT